MNERKPKTKIDWHLAIFFAIAYLIAWPIAFIFGVDDEVIRSTHSPPIATILIYLPKFAFSISGLIMFGYTGQLKEMWTRLTHWRVHLIWYLLAYFGPALLYLASALTSNLLSLNQPLSPLIEFPSIFWMMAIGTQTGILTYFLFHGGLGEEIGLRGFALPRLQTRYSPLTASLIIGFWWGLWHLPAWIGRSVLEIIIVWLGVISFSIIFTWFYNNTKSLLVVMLFHAALNSFDDVYENIFPALINQNWELPYVAGILLLGLILAFALTHKVTLKSTPA